MNVAKESTALDRSIGNYLAGLRRDRGVSQAALAIELGHDQSYVSKIEHAQRRVSLAEAMRWAAALGVAFDTLCHGLKPLWLEYVQTSSIWERD